MEEYLNIFIDKDYPSFIDKYTKTKSLQRIKYVTQFCGSDYTKLYSPSFLYTRYTHSLVVAHMTWHFTHSKKETISALLHDIGTPCFAHCIDYVFGDYMNQESSEKSIPEIIKNDQELLQLLKEDGIALTDLEDYSKYHILENNSPRLCTDRLDGVLHTVYVWLHTHYLHEIKEVYDNLTVLTNEDNLPEIGFNSIEIAEKFTKMVFNYAKELQGNTDKYIMKYIAEMVKESFKRQLLTLENLYTLKEEEICEIFENNFSSWTSFKESSELIRTEEEPTNHFYVSFATKKRNTIPLVKVGTTSKRINEVSSFSKELYDYLDSYHDTKYAYLENVKELDEGTLKKKLIK